MVDGIDLKRDTQTTFTRQIVTIDPRIAPAAPMGGNLKQPQVYDHIAVVSDTLKNLATDRDPAQEPTG
jgi:hypothetical protein